MTAAGVCASGTELTGARALRAAAAQEGLGRSDFEVLQHAVAARGSVTRALVRMRRLARVRRAFRTADVPPADALRHIRTRLAGFGLAAYAGPEGAVLFVNYAAFRPATLPNEDHATLWQMHIAASIAVLDALTGADVETMRRGVTIVADCAGAGWQNFSVESQRRFLELYQNAYPIRVSRLIIVDAPLVMSAFLQLTTVFMTPKMRARIKRYSRKDFISQCDLPVEERPTRFDGDFEENDFAQRIDELLAQRQRGIDTFRL